MARFRRGERRPSKAGRKRGTKNKATQEIKTVARLMLEDPVYRRNLRARLRAGTAPHIEALLYHYAFGKPADRHEQVAGAFDREALDAARVCLDVIRRTPEFRAPIEIEAREVRALA